VGRSRQHSSRHPTHIPCPAPAALGAASRPRWTNGRRPPARSPFAGWARQTTP
jgi:hypothetical protein